MERWSDAIAREQEEAARSGKLQLPDPTPPTTILANEALNARFAAEAELGIRENIEIVAMSAASEEELKRTHGRYFLTVEELADGLTAA